MKCTKDYVITIGLLLTVIFSIGGLGLDQINTIRENEFNFEKRIEKNIDEIKNDIHIIQSDIKIILRGG